MTDKQLDEKLINAFDNVRADSSVKARIRKGLTGDDMNDRNITVSSTENKTGTTERITVNRTSRIAAAAIAVVLAVGGGMFMLKNNFERVAPKQDGKNTSVSTSTAAGTDSRTEVPQGTIPEIFTGNFDPSGETVYDKFGKDADIWRLKNGNFLIKQTFDPNDRSAELYGYDYYGLEHHYFLYDPTANSVIGTEVVTESPRITVYEDRIMIFSYYYGDPNEYGAADTTDIQGTLYDLDLEPIRTDISSHIENSTVLGTPLLAPDDTMYVAAVSYRNTDDGQKHTLTVYNEAGDDVVFQSEEHDGISSCSLSKDGGFFYYGCVDNDENGGYKETKYTDIDDVTPMYFNVGKYLYTIFHDEDGRSIIRKADISGEEGLSFTQPVDNIVMNTRTSPLNSYVSENGKYLFTNENTEEGSHVVVYDISNFFLDVYDETVDGADVLFDRSGCNILFDEESGDVCIGGFTTALLLPSSRLDKALCFNLCNSKYTNFGIDKEETVYNENDTEKKDNGAVTKAVTYTVNEAAEPAKNNNTENKTETKRKEGTDNKKEEKTEPSKQERTAVSVSRTDMYKKYSPKDINRLNDSRFIAVGFEISDIDPGFNYTVYDFV